VKQYLVSKGIVSSRLERRGYGESQSIAPNTESDGKDNPEGRAMNCRVFILRVGLLTFVFIPLKEAS